MSTRKQVRLRKEYLYRKSLEGKEKVKYEKKQLLKKALAEGKSIPTEIRRDEEQLRHEIQMEDAETQKLANAYDDEYSTAGHKDPRVCVTTSREPSSRLKQFAKEVNLNIPNAQRINRGKYNINSLIESARKAEFSDVVILQETRGEPDGLLICHLPLGPTAYFTISNCVLRHDIADCGTMSKAYPHLIVHNFSTALGKRTTDIFRYLFPVPKSESKRVITLANDDDYISFRHHVWERQGNSRSVVLKEVGPRFEMQLYQIKLGTVDQSEADNEWVLRPYMNSSKRRRFM
eukprot:CAMPEP_0171473350 /NCGR_PEP_ID=MMETSP0946-20130122/1789_1 /TAXON_ID=109269 /ORGANISM="Vaucheria litorea, Strain CCMP2940" /LENGTH=289 /DNA_ID=CAMNT_0012003097 /DNA_START=82 /DNA_END=951 /DNA_ORIENTATION=-